MPVVCASASEAVNIVAGTAKPTAAAPATRENILRRETHCIAMLLLMLGSLLVSSRPTSAFSAWPT